MDAYTPTYTISDKMLKLVSDAAEKIGRISNHQEFTAKPLFRSNNRIRSVYSALRMTGNSLSLQDVRDIGNGGSVSGDQKMIQEVKGAFAAYEKIPELEPSDLDHVRKIHGLMTQGAMEEREGFRKGETSVLLGDTYSFAAQPAAMVPELLQNLLSWVKNCEGKVHPLIVSALVYSEWIAISPFACGNERMAMFVQTVILYRWRSVFEYLPLTSQIEKRQKEYYAALYAWHENGNSAGFIEFTLEIVNQALDEVVLDINKANTEISVYVQKMLDVMEYGRPYTANELMEKLGLKSRDGLRKSYLHPALELGLIRMTIADKPNSRNQRYMKQ